MSALRAPVTPAQPIMLPSLVGARESEIERLISDLELWVLLDQSGSVFADWGDPRNARGAAIRSLFRLIADSGAGGTAGLVQWGSYAPIDMAIPAVVLRHGRAAIDNALADPIDLGGTDLAQAVATALRLMQPLAPSRRRSTVIVSDGIQTVDSAVRRALSDPALGSTHMLLIDRSQGCSKEMELDWRSCQLESVTRLEKFGTKAMSYEMAGVLARELQLELGSETVAGTRGAIAWKRQSWWRRRTRV